VGVGWGNYVVAWLLSYQGGDCGLWKIVFEKCMQSEMCKRIIEMLLSIGLSIIRHKCYAETINTEVTEANQHLNQAPNHSHNNPSKPPQQRRTTRNRSKLLKTKLPNRLDAYALLSLRTTPPFSLSSTPPT
jgi:predicted transcriptional regulator